MIAQLNTEYLKRRPARALSRLASYALFEGRALLQPGRWINPLVFAHFALEKKLPEMKEVSPPVFIMGTGRSGTTILGTVLSFHPSVGFLNEPKALWYSVCPEEDIIGSYAATGGRYLLTEKDATGQVCREARKLYGAYLRLTGNCKVVDKSDWTFRLPFLRRIFPGARFLWLVRSGWDTCASINSWSRQKATQTDAGQYDWWGKDDRKWRLLLERVVAAQPIFQDRIDDLRGLTEPRDRAVLEWVLNMRQGLAWHKRYPAEVCQVRFEALCASPREVVRDLLDFCQLAPDEGSLEYSEAVLRPARHYPSFDLPDCLQDLFFETMYELNYDPETSGTRAMQ